MLRWHRVRYHGLPIAPCLQPSTHHSDLGLLLNDKRSAALRARLGQRHVRRRVIAIRISRAPIKNARAPASAFTGASALDEFPFIAFRALDAHRDRPRVLALRIPGAADELPEASALLHQVVAAQRALFL